MPGYKGPDDLKILVRTDGWESPTLEELFTMLKAWYENEERLYPPPAKGSRFLMLALIDLRTESVEQVLKRYGLENLGFKAKPVGVADFIGGTIDERF